MADTYKADPRFNVVVVPDGIHGGRLRLSLAVAPDPNLFTASDLAQWPKTVIEATRTAGQIANLHVAFGSVSDAPRPDRTITTIAALDDAAVTILNVWTPGEMNQALEQWDRLFNGKGAKKDTEFKQFDALRKALLLPGVGPTAAQAQHHASYDSHGLSHMFGEIYAASVASNAAARLKGGTGTPVGPGWWRNFMGQLYPAPSPSQSTRLATKETAAVIRMRRRAEFFHDEGELAECGPPPHAAFGQVRQVLARAVGDTQFWHSGMSAAATCEPAAFDAIRMEIEEAQYAWKLRRLGTCDTPPPDGQADDGSDDVHNAARKYCAILSFPTLARFFGFIIDIEIDISNKMPAPIGAVAAYFGSASSDVLPTALNWSSYAYRPQQSPPQKWLPYFGPCAAAETRTGFTGTPNDGLVDLGSGDRFGLHVIDVTKMVNAIEGQIKPPTTTGRRVEASDELPEVYNRGIALVDKDRLNQEKLLDDRDQEIRDIISGKVGKGWRISDAEDLTRGYRIDAYLVSQKPGAPQWVPERWRTLMARRIDFGKDTIPDTFIKANFDAHPELLWREDNHLRAMRARSSEIDVTHDELFCWAGESLALSSSQSATHEDAAPDPAMDLDIDIVYALDPGGDGTRRPPPLREGWSYFIGARLTYLNGCGLTLQDAASRYCETPPPKTLPHFRLGGRDAQNAETPFDFGRHESIKPPDLLLPASSDEALYAQEDPADIHGDAIDVLVVRADDAVGHSARYLVAPRLGFDCVEQSGRFDQDKTSTTPPGAFHNKVQAVLDIVTAQFPFAREGTYEFTDLKKPPTTKKSETSRGQVLVLGPGKGPAPATAPDPEYYPDPLVNGVRAELWDVEGTAAVALPPCKLAFSVGSGASDLWPIRLELQRAAGNAPQPAQFSVGSEEIPVADGSGGTVKLPKLVVTLKPAESRTVRISSCVDIATCFRQHAVAAGAERIARQNNLDIDAFRNVFAENCVTPLMRYRQLTLVHAVPKPLQPPKFYDRKPVETKSNEPPPTSDRTIHAVTISVKNTDPASGKEKDPTIQSWLDYVTAQGGGTGANPLQWPSVAGGSTTFFVGELGVHRLSTGKVRCMATWKEYGTTVLRPDPKVPSKWKLSVPEQSARLFAFDRPAPLAKDGGNNDRIGLLFEDDGSQLRGYSHAFTDGKARHLAVNLIATSAFTGYYAKDDTSQGDMGSHDLADSTASVWVTATQRPIPPVVDHTIAASTGWRETPQGGESRSWRRDWTTRVYLTPDCRYSSGEGEIVAIATVSDEAASKSAFCDFEEKVGKFSTVISRRGADNIYKSARVAPELTQNDLSNPNQPRRRPTTVSGLTLHLAEPKPDEEADPTKSRSLPVDIGLFEPEVDCNNGLWYVDVGVEAGQTYQSHLQLCLAWYQPRSAKGLELSTPATINFQVPPWREAKVDLKHKDKNYVVLTVNGPGYQDIAAATTSDPPPAKSTMPAPTLRVLVLQAANGFAANPQWQRAFKDVSRLIEPKYVAGTYGADGIVTWKLEFRVPYDRITEVRYGLLIEELRLMEQDRGPQQMAELSEVGTTDFAILDLRYEFHPGP